MTTKELIQEQLDRLSEEDLEQVYDMIRDFARTRSNGDERSFMSKLRAIRIDAPEDFAANLDAYTNGEKSVEENLR
jgi:nitrogen regulatory protein PII